MELGNSCFLTLFCFGLVFAKAILLSYPMIISVTSLSPEEAFVGICNWPTCEAISKISGKRDGPKVTWTEAPLLGEENIVCATYEIVFPLANTGEGTFKTEEDQGTVSLRLSRTDKPPKIGVYQGFVYQPVPFKIEVQKVTKDGIMGTVQKGKESAVHFNTSFKDNQFEFIDMFGNMTDELAYGVWKSERFVTSKNE